MEIKQGKQVLSNTTINYLHCGGSKEPKSIVVCLHGFPENSWTWEHYLYALSDDFDVYAPDLPGYNFSQGFNSDSDYSLSQLISSIAEFVAKISNGRKVYLVAHDWGGVIAWPLCAFHEALFEKLIILNAAHPSTFTREMLSNKKQQRNSNYISDLVSQDAYSIVSQHNFNMLKRLYGGYFERLSQRQKTQLMSMWADENSMCNSFAYYKQMPVLVTEKSLEDKPVSENRNDVDFQTNQQSIPDIRVNIPTLVLWGMKDTAFVPEVLEGMENYVQDLQLIKFDDADHWLHHQNTQEVLANIRRFIV